MSERFLHGVRLECIQGDIASQSDMDAVANAANAELRIGGGVAGAPGRGRGAHNLPNRYVIHCLGPVYGMDEPAEELLVACFRNVLALAEKYGIASVAYPAISTGACGYPLQAANRVALTTVAGQLPQLSAVQHIRFVLHEPHSLQVHEQVLASLPGA